MTFAGLSWFRSRQRKLARGVLALFCLTWLQVAAMPCLMASQVSAVLAPMSTPAQGTDAGSAVLPANMGSGEHCPYCPPASSEPAQQGQEHPVCAYPHDPQVDSRAGLALGMALPAVAPVFTLSLADRADVTAACPAPPFMLHGTSLAVSYCRFLK